MNQLFPKGTYGYISRQRKIEIIKTILIFAVSAALYISGIMTTGSNKNLLTIVAVLGCLPGSKSAVSMIMFLRAKGCSSAVYEAVKPLAEGISQRYDLYLTGYKKNFQISHMVMKGNSVAAFSEDPSLDVKACMEHLTTYMNQNGYKDVSVKIYTDLNRYCERLSSMQENSAETKDKYREQFLAFIESLSL